MIGYLHLYIITEFQFYISLFEQAENETCSQFYAVAYICIINSKQMRIFIPHCKNTSRRSPDYRTLIFKNRLTDRAEICFSLLARLIYQTVGNQSHSAAFLFFKQMHSIAYCVKHTHHIFTQPGEIIIDVATVEETYMLPVVILRSHRILFEPALECLGRILRKYTMMVYFQDSVHYHFHRLQRQCGIHYGSKGGRHSTYEIRICQHNIAQRRFLLAIFDTCQLNDVANLHIRRTSHFTTFTIQAIFQRFIKVFASFQAKTLFVRTGLLRTGIFRIHRDNRTIYRTNRTFDTLLKIVFAYIILLHIHDIILLLSYPLHIMP